MGNQVAHYIVWGKVWPGFSVISKRISDLCVASGNVRQRNVAPFTAWGGRIPQHILERLENFYNVAASLNNSSFSRFISISALVTAESGSVLPSFW